MTNNKELERAEAAREFIGNAFRDGNISASGTAIAKSCHWYHDSPRIMATQPKKQTVLDKLATVFERYFGLA